MALEVPMQTAPDHSPNEPVSASHGSMANSMRVVLPHSAWELWVAALLAISIGVNIWCAWTIRDIGTRKWLHDWDLQQFETGPFTELKTQVLVNGKLLTAFGPQECHAPPKR